MTVRKSNISRTAELLEDIKKHHTTRTNLRHTIRDMFQPYIDLNFNIPVGIIHTEKFYIICEDLKRISIEELMERMPLIIDGVSNKRFCTYYQNLSELLDRSHSKVIAAYNTNGSRLLAINLLRDQHLIRLYSMFNALRVYDSIYTLPNELKELIDG